ncbi:MAG: glutamate mutase L, partial [Bacteroidales bacterium]
SSQTLLASVVDGNFTLTPGTGWGVGQGAQKVLRDAGHNMVARWALHEEAAESDVIDAAFTKSLYPYSMATTPLELETEQAIAREALRLTEERAMPMWANGNYRSYPDLPPLWDLILVAGGYLTHQPHFGQCALTLLDALQPIGVCTLVADALGLTEVLGAVGAVQPLAAAQVLEHDGLVTLGSLVCPVGSAREGETVMRAKLTYANRQVLNLEIAYGSIEVIPLPAGRKATLELRPSRQFDIGWGRKGRGAVAEVDGGILGIIIDARGRPLQVEGIFAAGGELKGTFCIGRGKQAVLSQHIGDLQHAGTYDFYLEAVQRFRKMYRFTPTLVAADLHPDYLATRYAESLGLPVERVQHHHAHIAACMAEYGLDEPVIGLSFDGTGLGDDGNIWGSEVMVATLESYERREHAGLIALPGGDRAALEPWRTGMSLLYDVYGKDALPIACNLMPEVSPDNFEGVAIALEKGINIVRSSGLGRLFDGVAALTGICLRPTFEAEGPMRLESIAKPGVTDSYLPDDGGCFTIQAVIKAITEDLFSGVPVPFIAAKFHNSVILFATGAVQRAHTETGIRKVVLSGGAFQNRILAEKLTRKLSRENYLTFMPSQVPCNDGGLSLGQLAVAAKRRKL